MKDKHIRRLVGTGSVCIVQVQELPCNLVLRRPGSQGHQIIVIQHRTIRKKLHAEIGIHRHMALVAGNIHPFPHNGLPGGVIVVVAPRKTHHQQQGRQIQKQKQSPVHTTCFYTN